MILLWYIAYTLICMASSLIHTEDPNIQLQISRQAEHTTRCEEPVHVLIMLHGNHSDLLSLAKEIRTNLEATAQISVKISHAAEPRRTDDISQRFHEGDPFVLYLTMHEDESEVHGRLYNTLDVVMLRGKKWKRRPNLSLWANSIAHDIWNELMGGTSSFLSSIAYVTKEEKRSGAIRSNLVVTDWRGLNSRIATTRPTHMLAPAWLPTPEQAEKFSLVFSEFTPVNVRLMKTSTRTTRVHRVFDLPGTLVGVSARDSDHIVYCKSGTVWSYTYDPVLHTGTHTPIIRETHPCACPVVCSNGNIIYCTEGKIKQWSSHDSATETLISRGFCTSPALHEGSNSLIYSRRVKGTFQLVLYDRTTGTENQITHGPGNKIDPSFSPCGSWVVYTIEQGKKSSIALINILTKESREISAPTIYAFCPSWSPE